jgi:hypothetical protein
MICGVGYLLLGLFCLLLVPQHPWVGTAIIWLVFSAMHFGSAYAHRTKK